MADTLKKWLDFDRKITTAFRDLPFKDVPTQAAAACRSDLINALSTY
jgi:hypothetical protein